MKDSPPDFSERRLDALVRLLADDSEKIRRIAGENLTTLWKRAEPFIRRKARQAHDPRVRSAATRFLREVRRSDALTTWLSAAGGGSLDLEEGAILVARAEFPDLDPGVCRKTLDEYAAVLKKRLLTIRSPDEVFDRISKLLFREIGFRGNRTDYYDPRNSYLNFVLERKLGIPITLSVVFILVARRLGQSVEGVAMPGHFILRYRSGRHTRFLDAFDQGRRWTHKDCVAHLEAEGYGFHEEYLRAVEDHEILARMLSNLLGIYHGRKDAPRTDRVTRMLSAIQA